MVGPLLPTRREADGRWLPVGFAPRGVLRAYLWLMPLTYSFALAAVAPLPLLFAAAVVATVRWFWRLPLRLRASDLPLLAVLLLGWLPCLLAPSGRSFTHAGAWTVTAFLYFLVPRALLGRAGPPHWIARRITDVLFAVSCLVIVQSLVQNALGIDIVTLVPHPDINAHSDWTVFHGAWYRARGLSEEPGHSSLFFELALPFALLGLRRRPVRRGLVLAVCLVAYLMLFSSASIVALAAAAIAGALLFSRRSLRNVVIGIVAPVVLVTALALLPPARSYLQNTVIIKTTALLDPRVGIPSSQDRRQRFADLVHLVTHAPFGVGFGTVSATNAADGTLAGIRPPSSFISLYGDVAAAAGVAGLVCLLLFLADRLRRLLRNRSPYSRAAFVALTALCLHYAFVGNFWYPFLWFAVALADTVPRGAPRAARVTLERPTP